ncbi:MAG TPA: mandelate racemase/muconate lactonizing enzyme family protein [Acidimicrobiales bacterium]|nr:mandelate racemase/muconate lactonizing enzyme family protein [Acidimicrobiales bacterium]
MQLEDHVNTRARSSRLRITDVRLTNLVGVPFRSAVLRIETNEGLVGYGEVRDGATKNYALMLKRHLVGRNPCDLDRVFRSIKQFGHHGRQGGGVSGVEVALMDLAGKAYDVPVYALIGGKFRDRVLCYADTDSSDQPEEMAARLKERRARGFRWLKMDIGVGLLRDVPGGLTGPPGAAESTMTMHPFTGLEITRRGVEYLAEYVAKVRDIAGYDFPLSADHFGHIGLASCIRLIRALEPYGLAWVEDLIPWQLTGQWRELTTSVTLNTCTGEDIYLKEGFRPLIEQEAVRIIHPDPMTAGGIAETKRIGDLAEEHGIAMALHLAATPIATMASVHIAAATNNFLVLEHHAADVEGWSDLVTGLPSPLIVDGYIDVPDTPGLGFDDVNEDALRRFADPADPSLFAPTDGWGAEISNDRLWS